MLNDSDIEVFKAISNKPALFSINKVEECYIFILGYSMSDSDKNIHGFINSKFSNFIKRNFNSIEGEWYQIIRYQATTDAHSLELFKKYFNLFLDEIVIK
jgi:hypothetical protein